MTVSVGPEGLEERKRSGRCETRKQYGLLAGGILLWLALGLMYWPAPNDEGQASLVMALSSGVDQDSTLDEIGSIRLAHAIQVAKRSQLSLITSRVLRKKPALSSDYGQQSMLAGAGVAWAILPGVASVTRDEAL